MDDVIIQAQSTAFQRTGDTWHRRGFSYSQPALGVLLSQITANGVVSNDTAGYEQALLRRLLGWDEKVLPGGLTLKNVQSIIPSAFNGADDLEAIYSKDPWSTEYEDETNALYERSYSKARAVAQSGPAYVRGGTARAAFELTALDVEMSNNRFREIWQAQLALASLVNAAIQIAADKEAERWRLQLQAQQQQAAVEQARTGQMLQAVELVERMRENNAKLFPMNAELQGMPTMWIHEELAGEGQQGSAQTTFGMNYWR